VARKTDAKPRKGEALTLGCDELRSFVGNKANKQWVWLALDRDARAIVGVHIGDRSWVADALVFLALSLPGIGGLSHRLLGGLLPSPP